MGKYAAPDFKIAIRPIIISIERFVIIPTISPDFTLEEFK